MSTDFPFVNVPSELHRVVGEPIRGTRMYRKTGPQEEIGYWQDAIFSICDDAVSPGGCIGYVSVSRAAVHKRMKEGKLTCFLFDITHRKRNLFGVTKQVRELAVALIPVSECKAWQKELEQRAIDQGLVTEEELEGDKPDWHGEFLDWNSRWQKQQASKAKESKK